MRYHRENSFEIVHVAIDVKAIRIMYETDFTFTKLTAIKTCS